MAPAASTVSLSNEQYTPGNSADGTLIGSSGNLVGFFGTTPVVQQTAIATAAITDTSGGTAHASTGMQALTSSYNSTLVANSLSTLAAGLNAIEAALAAYGLIK